MSQETLLQEQNTSSLATYKTYFRSKMCLKYFRSILALLWSEIYFLLNCFLTKWGILLWHCDILICKFTSFWSPFLLCSFNFRVFFSYICIWTYFFVLGIRKVTKYISNLWMKLWTLCAFSKTNRHVLTSLLMDYWRIQLPMIQIYR